MKIAIWKTGHEIADRVAQSLAEGYYTDQFQTGDINNCIFASYQAHIGYGILRGSAEVFKRCGSLGIPWFNVDRGYFNPNHFDGYYRISYRGTQFKWHEGIPRKPIDINLEPWRTKGDYVLICPPTQDVCDFFDIDYADWVISANMEAFNIGASSIIKQKHDDVSIEWNRVKAIITFNSSLGWQALQMGIPVLSDVNHSAVGSFYNCSNLQSLTDKLQNMPDNRMQLFEAMAAHQFTLAEIEQGKAWPILEHYLSMYSSDLMTGKPSPQMLQPIASLAEQNQTLKSIFSNTGN